MKRESYQNMVKAEGYFEQATEREPAYALAWAGLADVCFNLASYFAPPELRPSLFEKAVSALDRAL